MKKKILWRTLIVSLLAFLLYLGNWQHMQHASLHVLTPNKSKVTKQRKTAKEPKTPQLPQAPRMNAPEYESKVKIEAGSQKKLAAQIKKTMGSRDTYQVAVQDLNNSSRYARLGSSDRIHHVGSVMRLYLLVAVAKEEQKGKLGARSVITVHASDRQKGEKMLQTNMGYGIQYLRQAMMRGDQTAANALLRKVGISQVNKVIRELGAKHTRMLGNFKSEQVGETTANDLDASLKSIYQGRVLNRQYAYQVLGAMHGKRSALAKEIKGNVYSVGDNEAALAMVQDGGHSYCISVYGSSSQNFAALGKTVADWFKKEH